MTRKEHLEWCKNRALEYVESGDCENAVASMLSDLRKHPELEDHMGGKLGMMLLVGGQLGHPDQVRSWIVGFN